MPESSGINMEFEQIGMVALIGLALVPGMIWVSKAKTGTRMALRTSLVTGLIVGLVALEASLDKTAESVAEAL
ncbi:hypothetical protein [Granulicella tundricola]|uniref:Uncharacterized protein n=1 Tax=Granulicella tundricola (strain ATCC BAA-1859 / DSM 23138 / MP5ACTX9) TaxID=1198114 RepID=E8X0C7_GRATM|nr:hypothetical protein [Granulicella tundricola]ADW70108.1 hypothetical protein AciX9_3088 [Granulicella tundricola MP5ACTX9]